MQSKSAGEGAAASDPDPALALRPGPYFHVPIRMHAAEAFAALMRADVEKGKAVERSFSLPSLCTLPTLPPARPSGEEGAGPMAADFSAGAECVLL